MTERRAIALALIIAIIVSAALFVLSSKPDIFKKEIDSIDRKKDDVTLMVISSSGSSIAISTLPGDIATPIAEQLAQISKAFIIILSVLYGEKYLLPICGQLSAILAFITLSALLVTHLLRIRSRRFTAISFRMLALALVTATFIPIGLTISDTIESIYRSSLDEMKTESLKGEEALNGISFDKDTRNIFAKMGDWVGDQFEKSVGKTKDLLETAKKALSDYLEMFAIMIVLDCVIPILTLVLYALFLKWLFGLSSTFLDLDYRNIIRRLHRGIQKPKCIQSESDQ